MRRFYIFTREGQRSIGIVLLCLMTIGIFMMVFKYKTSLHLLTLERIYADILPPSATETEEMIRSVPLWFFFLAPPFLASLLYFHRSTLGAFAMLQSDVRRGRLTSRWLIRSIWTTVSFLLVAMLFGITNPAFLITLAALNLLSHVFLIEMDRTNLDLPFVEWAPLFISMLLFVAQMMFVVAAGFDSLQLRELPALIRRVLIVYLMVQSVFYLETVLHYGGYGKWKNIQYSENAFSINDVFIHGAMLWVYLSLLQQYAAI